MEIRELFKEAVAQAHSRGMSLSKMEELVIDEYRLLEENVEDEKEVTYRKMVRIFLEDVNVMYGDMSSKDRWIAEEILVQCKKNPENLDYLEKLYYTVKCNTNLLREDVKEAKEEFLSCLRKKFKTPDMRESEAFNQAILTVKLCYNIPEEALT